MSHSHEEQPAADIATAFRARVGEAMLEHAQTNERGDLIVEVQPPPSVGGPALVIQVDADLDEVIVVFGGGHSHGGPWRASRDPDFQFKATFDLIDGILNETIVAYRLRDGSGGLIRTEQIRGLPRSATVRSWAGTYGQE